jgi:hypothetical protein
MKILKCAVFLIAIMSFMPTLVRADVVWDWSFDNTSGKLVTNGNNYAAGTFALVDFSVTATDTVATIGSLLGGQYTADGYGSTTPYSMEWNGSEVTKWDSAGSNTFDWWVFTDFSGLGYVLFGWEQGNINTVNQAIYYRGLDLDQPSFVLTVGPENASTVPEPASLILFGSGLGLVSLSVWRRKK